MNPHVIKSTGTTGLMLLLLLLVSCEKEGLDCFELSGATSDRFLIWDEQNLHGYINRNGEVVIPCQYRWARSFYHGYAVVGDVRSIVIDIHGKTRLDTAAGVMGDFSKEGIAPAIRGRKFGYVDQYGSELVPFQYNMSTTMTDGLGRVESGFRWGFYSADGEHAIPCTFASVGVFSNGRALVRDSSRLCGYIDRSGKLVIPHRFREARTFSENLAAVWLPEGPAGFIDREGSLVIEAEYASAQYFTDGLAAVMQNGVWGFIDRNGDMVISPAYEDAKPFFSNRAGVKTEGKWGFIDKKGQMVIEPLYGQVGSFVNGLALVMFDDRHYAYIDTRGRVIHEMPAFYHPIAPLPPSVRLFPEGEEEMEAQLFREP
ncbi:MAG: WG repeat-containing protein [Bacteroidales bacterium]